MLAKFVRNYLKKKETFLFVVLIVVFKYWETPKSFGAVTSKTMTRTVLKICQNSGFFQIRIFPYREKYCSEKTRTLAYFTQC